MISKKEKILKIMADQKGRFMTVVFKKKNGERRVMNIQPEAGKFRAKNTGKVVPEHLASVWDVKKKAFRSFDYDSVEEIRASKKVERM